MIGALPRGASGAAGSGAGVCTPTRGADVMTESDFTFAWRPRGIVTGSSAGKNVGASSMSPR
jgi:hypothetical protein